MTATSVPSRVYLDTSVIVATISSGDPFNLPCTAYCTALIANNSRIYFSQLLRLEYAQFIRTIATDSKKALPQHLFEQYQLKDYGKDMMIRHRWMAFMTGEFDALLARFYSVQEFPIRPPILRQCSNLMSFYSIKSYDAAHLATALSERIPLLATTDKDFATRVTSGLVMHLIR